MYVIDLENNRYELQVTSTRRTEINKNEELSFRISPTKTNLIFMQEITELWRVVDHDGTTYKVIYFNKRGEGDLLSIDIKAIPVYIDNMRSIRIYERYDLLLTRDEYFYLIFAGTDYYFYFNDFYAPMGPSLRWEGLGEGNDLASMFAEGLERYNLEYEYYESTFILHDLIDYPQNYMIRHKLNASNVTIENDASNFYTYARGYGDYGDGEGGQDWQDANLFREYTSPMAAIFGKRDAPPIKNGNIKSSATMDEQLKLLVDDSLKISITVDYHDLRSHGYPGSRPVIGDRVPVIDERINFQEDLRIIAVEEIKDDRGETLDVNVTLGDLGLVERHQTNIRKAIKNVNDLFDGRKTLSYDVLPAAVKRASDALLGALTELEITDQGIIARDPSNPDRLVLFNSAGLGVSTDGGNTFEDAITYLGINTNLLTAGQIHTNKINIIGEDNLFYWDGNELKAVDPNDFERFVRLNSSGLYISKGALTIERPDGFQVINNGIQRRTAGGFTPSPNFRSPELVEVSRLWRNDNGDTEWRDIEAYYFNHISRYVLLHIDGYVEENDFEARTEVRANRFAPGSPTLAQVSMNSVDSTTPDARQMIIDLGVPDGAVKGIIVQMRSSSPLKHSNARIRYFALEG